MKNKLYWIWLSLAAGPGSSLGKRLLEALGEDIQSLYSADEELYRAVKMSPGQKKRLLDKSLDYAEKIADWCTKHNVKLLCYDDDRYPKRLKEISDPPVVLYYIGELYDIDSLLCLASVGTRRMSRYGYETAYSFSYDIARSGAVVVSGLAAGIDTTCHRAALDAGGRTIAVIGCRINKVYPAENRELMREIARKGLLITEYHPFFKTQASNFPKRNRIISGLSQGTVIYEADANSGSLITARLARQQDRMLFALPGKIGEQGSLGTNDLIRNGAATVTRVTDILKEFDALYELKNVDRSFDFSPVTIHKDSFPTLNRAVRTKPEAQNSQNTNEPDISDPLEKEIYSKLSYDTPMSIDMLGLDYPASQILTALTMLELSGLIKPEAGNTYIKTN